MEETFEQWKAGFEGLDFEQQAARIKDRIILSDELDETSKHYFSDMFEYVMQKHKEGKPLDMNLLKIHMTQIKDYKALTLNDFTRALVMLSLCGFQFDFQEN